MIANENKTLYQVVFRVLFAVNWLAMLLNFNAFHGGGGVIRGVIYLLRVRFVFIGTREN